MALDADRMKLRNQQIIENFRASGGRLDRPLLLLHTVGARSGKERVNPVVYQQVGDAFAVFASAGGDDHHPAWFHNLVAHPDLVVEVGSETLPVRARVLGDDEREPIWTRQKAINPDFATYESRTERTIPVVLLERRVSDPGPPA